jgi:hypothetical protein
MPNSNSRGQLYQISNQYYYIEVMFFNGVYEKSVNLPMGIIQEINIKESLYNWWTSGYITLHNDFQFLEKGLVTKNVSTGNNESANLMCDRPDGRNKFCIRIYPVEMDDQMQKDFLETYRENFEICYDFVVYDIEDLPADNSEQKLKRYYLWDERYQIFLERNLEWSTALASKELLKLTKFDNEQQRKMVPNFAILHLLKTVGTYPDGSTVKVGYKEDGDISNPTFQLADTVSEEWDNGNDKNLVFYTSNPRGSALDDLNYLVSLCQDKDGYPCVLSLGRTSKNKKFNLTSLKKIFDDSKKNQIEKLTLVETKDGVYDPSAFNYQARGPADNVYPLQNFESGQASRITSYQFSPMVNLDDLNYKTSPLHYFDFDTGEFNIKFKENTINNFIKKASEMTSKLYNLQKSKKGQLLIKNNKIKQDNGMIKNYFTATKDVPSSLPLMQMLKDFIFLNQSLVFQTYGLTHRTPGKFVTVESVHSSSTPNDFWDKFLGQWLITEVQHTFTKNLYSNVVTASKVDAGFEVYPIQDSKNNA